MSDVTITIRQLSLLRDIAANIDRGEIILMPRNGDISELADALYTAGLIRTEAMQALTGRKRIGIGMLPTDRGRQYLKEHA